MAFGIAKFAGWLPIGARQLTICIVLSVLSSLALAEQPPDATPVLRIEAGSHLATIKRISVSADGRLLATGSDDKTARLWNLTNGTLIRTFRPPIGEGNGGKVHAVALSPDGRILAAGGWDAHAQQTGTGTHFLYLFDTGDGRLLSRLGPLPDVTLDLAFSQSGNWLAAALGHGGVRLWRAQQTFSGSSLADAGYQDSVYSVDFAGDDRLAAAGMDGRLRIYGLPNGPEPQPHLIKAVRPPDGRKPIDIAFSPDGARLAVAYLDTPAVSILDAATLRPVAGKHVDTRFLRDRRIYAIAWSADGSTLYAAGNYEANSQIQVMAWGDGGFGEPHVLGGPIDAVLDLASLPGGGVAWSASDTEFGIVNWPAGGGGERKPVTADFRAQIGEQFRIAPDAGAVWIGLTYGGGDPWRLNVTNLTFDAAPSPPPDWMPPSTDRFPAEGWVNGNAPVVNGQHLRLRNNETSRSLAMAPDGESFVLGTDFSIYRFDAAGQQLWRKEPPGSAYAVNLSSDGALIVAALGDGTIRWYRASDGAELLAFFIYVPDKRWVMWTPSGYYAASPGGEDFIGWQINGAGWDEPVDFFPASRFRSRFYRPDIVQIVLATRDEAAAIAAANVIAKQGPQRGLSIQDLPPVVAISADPRGLETDQGTVEVRYRIRTPSQQPITRLEVRVDGQLTAAAGSRGVSESAPADDGTAAIDVPVPDHDCEITLVAFHDDQASAPAKVHVRWTGAPARPVSRRLFALLIGISDYDDPQLKLRYAGKDASDLAAALMQQKGKFFSDVFPTLLLNHDASETAIETALADIREKAGPDDYAVVFLAGHGATLKNRFYFLPSDADPNASTLDSSSLRGDRLAAQLGAMKGKVLLFVDACYSARALRFDMPGFINAVTGEQNAVMMYSSSSANEVSYEGPQWQNGAFTKALVAILSDPAAYDENGKIITDELAVQLRRRVSDLTNGQQTPIGRASDAVPPFPVASR